MALKPTTFRSQPAANAAILPNKRESITGVVLKDEIPPDWLNAAPKIPYEGDSGMDSMKEQRLNPKGQLSRYPVHLKDFND